METNIDPKEWKKEYERVKDQLKISKQRDLSGGTDVEEINNRRM